MDAGDPPETSRPAIPPGYALVRRANWWFASGLMIMFGGILIGLGFVFLAYGVVMASSSPNYPAAFYSFLGFGIMLISSSWALARIEPRTK